MHRPTGDEILAEVTEELAHSRLDIHAILSSVTGSLSRRRPGTWVAVVLNKDPTTSRVVVADDSNRALAESISQYVASLNRPGHAPTSGLSRQIINTGQPVLWPVAPMERLREAATPHAQEYYQQHRPVFDFDSVGVLMVPMHCGEATVGSLGLLDWGARQELSDDDQRWVQSVADRVGLAVEHAQLRSAAVDRFERLTSLRNVALAITSSDDLRLTLEVILEQVTTRLRVDAGDVLMVDDSERELFAGAFRGFHSASIPNYRFPINPDLQDSGLVRREPIHEDLDQVDHGQRRSLFAREGFQFYMGMPLVVRNKLRGVLEVFSRSPLEPDQEWVVFMETMATHAAIAIDRSAMQEQIEHPKPVQPHHLTPAPQLSRLEQRILGLVVDGATNQEVAEKVHLSQNTVKFHVRRILQKAGAANRTELARIATQQSWL